MQETFELRKQKKENERIGNKDAVQIASTAAKSLMDSKEYVTQKFSTQSLLAMRNKTLTAVAQVNKWKRAIISQHDAEQQAKSEYMSKSERELWQKYFETLGQKKQLEEYLSTTVVFFSSSSRQIRKACRQL